MYNFGRNEILSNRLGFTGSGQIPPTWASMTWTFRPESIANWTLKMKPREQYIETATVNEDGTGKNAGLTFVRVKRYMIDPVKVYDYTEESLNIMLPMKIEDEDE